jgi:transposase
MEVIMRPKGQKRTIPIFHYFSIEDLVPEDHILRIIDNVVDFSFVHNLVKECYCSDNGRPGVDPELVFRMILIGYLYNLSEKRLCEEVKMHVAYRWFCKLSFDDNVPDRSTLNKLRNHRWASVNLFETIMHTIVQQCIDAGLVSGKHLGVDGTQIRANASIKSLEPIVVPMPLDDYLHELNPIDDDKEVTHPQDKDFHGTSLSNKTHRSKTDPDARLYRKSKGKEASLSYIGHNLIDTKSRVILATRATHASRSSEPMAALDMLSDLENFPDLCHKVKTLAADQGYGSGTFIADVLDRSITPHIPLLANKKPEPIPSWKNKTFKPHIQAQRNEKIRLVKARNYARFISLTSEYKVSQKLRKRTEHVFAEAKICHGLARARCRGKRSLQDQLYMTATIQNVKRLVSFSKKKLTSVLESTISHTSISSSYLSFDFSNINNLLFDSFHSMINKFKTFIVSWVYLTCLKY